MAATGPSLSPRIAERCQGEHVIAVSDAWRLFPSADVLYSCDAAWWDHHKGAPAFRGQRWSSHGSAEHDDKRACADRWALNLVGGAERDGLSLDPRRLHYGSNSGFQAVNLAILFGAPEILLVGFDLRCHGRQVHFFGDHPAGLRNDKDPGRFIPAFTAAARGLPAHIRIINCTPGSALTCFPMADLDDALTASA